MNGEMVAEFTIIGEPASKARARFTNYGSKVRAYTPAKTMQAESKITAAYLEVADPNHDKDQAFGVEVEFLHETGQRRDVDNMLKLILDGLNKVAWPDDVQVTRIAATKNRVPKGEALTTVRVYNLGQIDKPRGRCEHCAGEFAFYESQKARRFCTQACHLEWRRLRRERTCAHCGSEFESHHPEGDQRYCSRDCAYKAKHVEVVCVRCGTGFSKARSLARAGNSYCSDECKATFWRDQRKSAAKGTCHDCGGATTKKSYVRCRDCNFAAGGRYAVTIEPLEQP
jgi:Holliday junction resolvase RusA-like endonuclease